MVLLRFAICMLALTLLAGAMSYSSAQSDHDGTQAEAVTR
jgi:hypothetical protein